MALPIALSSYVTLDFILQSMGIYFCKKGELDQFFIIIFYK